MATKKTAKKAKAKPIKKFFIFSTFETIPESCIDGEGYATLDDAKKAASFYTGDYEALVIAEVVSKGSVNGFSWT